jgi:branched-chain amino acid transport system permease protein
MMIGPYPLDLLALQLVTGVALGAIYVLVGIGLSLIFGLMTIVNFAVSVASAATASGS